MSVESRIIIGHTINITYALEQDDFRKCDAFTSKYPELDEYNYRWNEKEKKVLMIADGMNGDYLRLVHVDKIIDGGNTGDEDWVDLPKPALPSREVAEKLATMYKEYTGQELTEKDIHYAMWTQWY
jgi:hypothetical protein